MGLIKQQLLNITNKTKILVHFPIRKIVITTVLVVVLGLQMNYITFANNSNLTTVYYVYLNDTYIGIVSDKSIIDNVLSEKLKTMEQSYKDLNLQFGSKIKYVPEQVFRSTANNKKTINNLENALQLKAEASAIIIDGKPVVYLENKNSAQEVIKKIKLQYVTEDQLKELEARGANTTLPPLNENETRLIGIHLSKNVSIEDVKAAPDQLLSIDQAVTFLQKGTIQEKKYKVQDGDVLGTVANGHNLKLSELLALNPGLTEDSILKIDQEVNITVPQPYIEVMIEKEVNQQETIPYQNEITEDSSMPKGENKVIQQGQNGLQKVTYHISEQNGISVKKDILNQEILQQPVNQQVRKGTKVIPSRGEGSLGWPAVGGYISSNMGYRWGKFHKGIDIARPSSKTIKAADNGVVVSAGWDNAYGNKIVIDHQNGYRTVYAHLSSLGVRAGQVVAKGSAIGVMGATGDATGVHLHFEVYKNGSLENPTNYIRR